VPAVRADLLNDDRAIETSGVLFTEGAGEPAEITRIKPVCRPSPAAAANAAPGWPWPWKLPGPWPKRCWAIPARHLPAERHKIIGNNWQHAASAQLIARYLRRAIAILEQIDFMPAALRHDLAGPGTAPAYLFSPAELINHAADLSAASSVLTHDNEHRWRIFHQRIEQITPANNPRPGQPRPEITAHATPGTKWPAGNRTSRKQIQPEPAHVRATGISSRG
jgi:hypothetical protein